MRNIFAATAHGNYARCARFYFQEMRDLPRSHSLLHGVFSHGQTAHREKVRQWIRSSLNWFFNWTIINALHEVSRWLDQWTWGDRKCLLPLDIELECMRNKDITTMTDTQTHSSEKHIELIKSQGMQHYKDTKICYDWLTLWSPFLVASEHLHSLLSVMALISGKDCINCERAGEIWVAILQSFDNQSI